MQSYYLTFTDGTRQGCQGQSAGDAVSIAEHLTGKTVAVEEKLKYRPQESDAVQPLPYPCSNMIWQHDHPVYGFTPAFCSTPAQCCGRSACPKSYSCTS